MATATAKEGSEEAEEGEAEKFLEGGEGEEGEEGGGEKFLEGHEGQEDDEYYYSSENEKKLANKLKKKYKKK